MSIYGNNRTLLREGGSWNNSSYMPLDCLIEAARTDMAIFDEVIGNDFYHAYSEAGLIYVTEDDSEKKDEKTKVGLWTRIKNFFKRIWEAIKGLFVKAKDKVADIVENDKDLWAKNGEAVKKNGVGKKIKTKKNPELYEKTFDDISDDKYENWINQFLDVIDKNRDNASIRNEEEFDNAIKGAKEELEKQNKEYEEKIIADAFKDNDEEKEIEMTQKMIDAICDNIRIGSKRMSDMLKAKYDFVDSKIKKINAIIDIEARKMETTKYDKDSQEEKDQSRLVGLAKAVGSAYVEAGQILNKKFQLETKAMTDLYSVQRSAFSSLAGQCSEKEEKKDEKKEEAKGESVEAWALGQLSDIYMEQAFNFY